MKIQRCVCIFLCMVVMVGLIGSSKHYVEGLPRRIILDTDVDTDDLFALLYILKLNTSEFHLEVSSLHLYIHICMYASIHVFICEYID